MWKLSSMKSPQIRVTGRRAVVTFAACLAVLVAQASSPFAPPAHAYGTVNNNPAFLQVYTNNVENLEKAADDCPGDWQDLVYYMKTYYLSPDLYLVQQVSGQAQIDALAQRMSDDLVGIYRGVAAKADPAYQDSPCAGKHYQTTGIIYRTGRLEPVTTEHWRANRLENGSCVNSPQERSAHLAIKFRDKINGKYVTAATVHFPTATMNGPECIDFNVNEVVDETGPLGGSLLIWGGDLNYTDMSSADNYRSWYSRTNGDLGGALGFRDILYDRCSETYSTAAEIKACLKANWTISGDRRIDFLFAKLTSGGMPRVDRGRTVSFAEGDAADLEVTGDDRSDRDYSDHRSVMGQIYYATS